jgi:hypothetical protein
MQQNFLHIHPFFRSGPESRAPVAISSPVGHDPYAT